MTEVRRKTPSKRVTNEALATLRSTDFFADLRGALSRAGLPGEERFGLGVYLALVSRFRPNPLRLAIQQATDGNARHLTERVLRLCGPETIMDASSDEDWSRFKADPGHKIVVVPEWDVNEREGIRFEVEGNRITRVARREQDDRVVETPDTIEAPFVCVAPSRPPWQYRESLPDTTRWLTVRLPPARSRDARSKLDDDDIGLWTEVQRLLQLRAQLPILLPDWADVVISHSCRDEKSARHLPAFLEAWKTMTLLRSFRVDDEHQQREFLLGGVEDLAVASLLLRGAFREGRTLPSVDKVFDECFKNGEVYGVVSPITGRGVRYEQRTDPQASEESVDLHELMESLRRKGVSK